MSPLFYFHDEIRLDILVNLEVSVKTPTATSLRPSAICGSNLCS